MRRKLYIIIAVALVIAIAIIVIAPSLDLPPTALRAWYAAVALLASIAILSAILTLLEPPCFNCTIPYFARIHSQYIYPARSSPIELLCALLC